MVWWYVYYCRISKPSDQQTDREELARREAVEAAPARDAGDRNSEGDTHPDGMPIQQDVLMQASSTTQTPADDQRKSCCIVG